MNIRKAILYVLVIIFVCSVSFFAGAKFNNNKRNTENTRKFINHIYFEIDRTIHILSSVEDWGDSIEGTDVSTNPYQQLLEDMHSMIVMTEQGLLYMRNEPNSSCLRNFADSLTIVESAIGSGVSLNNQPICESFTYDGVLSEPEISFLILLRQDLENIKNNLFSEETNQEKENLSMKDLCDILKPFTDKYRIINLHNIGLKN